MSHLKPNRNADILFTDIANMYSVDQQCSISFWINIAILSYILLQKKCVAASGFGCQFEIPERVHIFKVVGTF